MLLEGDREAVRDTHTERSEKMLEREMVHLELGSVEEGLAGGGRELSVLLAALARAQEDATIEAQDILAQADEALVLG
jgi:hypothetical protein